MSTERVSLLNSIGFEWGPPKRDWSEMYLRLVAYKSVHSNTKVPTIYDQDPQLGNWVHNQRVAYNANKISDERAGLLNSIGFDWGSPRQGPQSSWNEMYQRLV